MTWKEKSAMWGLKYRDLSVRFQSSITPWMLLIWDNSDFNEMWVFQSSGEFTKSQQEQVQNTNLL